MDRKGRKEPSCVLCGTQFCFKDPTNPFGSRCPLLLQCGHSVCEGCMKSVSRGGNTVKCTVCGSFSDTTKFKNPDELREVFPLSVYTVGQVSLRRVGKGKGDTVIGFYAQKQKMTLDIVVCGECGVTPADCSCRQCSVKFCGSCFTRVHDTAQVLRQHEKVSLNEKIFTCEEVVCKEHPGKTLGLFCTECTVYCCRDCCYKYHLQHSCVEVLEKNKELLQEFSETYEEANGVLKLLLSTRKKLQNSGSQPQDEDALKVERMVSLHYSRLHGILQLHEEEILKKIRSAQEKTTNSLVQIDKELNKNIKEMETILSESKASMEPNHLGDIPLYPLLEKLKNVTAMPCHLILNDVQDTSKFEFNIDSSIFETLLDHCNVTVPVTRAYELRSKFDLPEDFVVESLPDIQDQIKNLDLVSLEPVHLKDIKEIQAPSLPPTEMKTKKPQFTSYQEIIRQNRLSLQNPKVGDTASNVSTDSFFEKMYNLPPLAEGTTDIVIMCHLIAPNDFYVQRKCTQNQLQQLLNYFSKQANVRKNRPDNIELGQMYLAQFSGDNKWYRGVVKKLDSGKCEIFYIDYGNTDEIPTSKLRELPEKYLKIPAQAIHCSLFGCAPVAQNWNVEACQSLITMSHGFELSMYVENINISSGLHEVHLRKVEDVNGSFTDALIFLNYAMKTESSSREEGCYKQLSKNRKTFFKEVGIKKHHTIDGQVTHVNTPTNFFVQQITDGGKHMLQLMNDLNSYYSKLQMNEHIIFNPTVGMAVAAKFTDGKWYRGVILEIPKPRLIQVQYVDFGNVYTVDWKDIRTLHLKFLRMGIQGLKCALGDVAPKNPKGWSNSAKLAFEKMVKNKLLRVHIEDVKPSHYSVVLYDSQTSKDICFNGMLVKKGHAISVGQCSAKSEFFHGHLPRGDSDSISTTSSVHRSLPSSKGIPSGNRSGYASFKNTPSHTPSTPASLASSDTYQNFEYSQQDDDKIKIKVLKAVSPSEVYIAFETIAKQLVTLVGNMTSHYNSTDREEREWSKGDLCAVLKKADKMWYRGLISDVTYNNYTVYIKDIVEMVDVDEESLRSLDGQFMQLMDVSVKCHMGGLLPPGGGKSWPATTTEFLASKVYQFDHFYIKKMGSLEVDSLPIQLWLKQEKVGGPLDPVIEEWCDIGQSLVDMGYALPDRRSGHFSAQRVSERQPTLDKEDSINFDRKNIVAWLNESFKDAVQSVNASNASDFDNMEDDPILSRPLSVTKRTVPKRLMNSIPKHIGTALSQHATDWRPAEPFKKLDFVAVPSYVDYDCAIYLQDIENSQNTLQIIQRGLQGLFEGSVAKPHDLVWSVGQLCIAFYDQDGHWYRGKVTEVRKEHIKVMFVDYGNVEELQPEQLRKSIHLETIPLQCHRCLTEGLIPISPNGKWPIKALDFIHGTIVTKECRVQLQPPINDGDEYIILKLTLPGNLDLMELLLSMHYATYVINCDEVGKQTNYDDEEIIEELDLEILPIYNKVQMNRIVSPKPIRTDKQDNHSGASNTTRKFSWFDMVDLDDQVTKFPQYKELILPDTLVELSVEVAVVSSRSLSLKVTIHKCDDEEVMSLISKFQLLQELIQEEAESMPNIKQPVKGMQCIGCYTDDDVWYRAVVLDVFGEEDLVKVEYVDYGNEEKIPTDRLRNIKEEWTDIPIQAVHVVLHNVYEGPSYEPLRYHNMLVNCLMAPPYLMTIEERQPCLQVELYNSDGEIAYQSVIDEGLLKKN